VICAVPVQLRGAPAAAGGPCRGVSVPRGGPRRYGAAVTSFADQRVRVISQRVMTTANLLGIIERYDLYASRLQDLLSNLTLILYHFIVVSAREYRENGLSSLEPSETFHSAFANNSLGFGNRTFFSQMM